jgi:hypothetical protein
MGTRRISREWLEDRYLLAAAPIFLSIVGNIGRTRVRPAEQQETQE